MQFLSCSLHLNTDLLDKEMQYWTTPPHFLLVATIDQSVVGLVSIQKKSELVSELNRLSVSSSARGLGLGKALVEAAIKQSLKVGFKNVYLETSDVQQSAIRIYEKVGFKLTGCYVTSNGLQIYVPHLFHGILIRKYLY
jgi:ribosomal protein S18 acetylase RimI-like enzyme